MFAVDGVAHRAPFEAAAECYLLGQLTRASIQTMEIPVGQIRRAVACVEVTPNAAEEKVRRGSQYTRVEHRIVSWNSQT